MDEPTVGIDPQSRNHILETVKKLNAEGMTIIYTSHYMEEVEFLCDKISIMDKGKIIASGTKEELLELVPQTERLTITFSKIDDYLLNLLKNLDGVVEVHQKENKIELIVKENNILKRMIETLQGTTYDILSMDIEKANLETVFLQLTGKALRD
jgi:ABC-2 type transport system ATP-binding protein